MSEKIAIIGLGYVGLPLALAFARKHSQVIGFDVDSRKIEELGRGIDRTGETSKAELDVSGLQMSSQPESLEGAKFYIVTVPTPIDQHHRPDLSAVEMATETIAAHMKVGAIVIYESTVYPGVTEEICGPILESISGLKRGRDFFLGYSPERINPGDKEHTIEKVVKVVAGENSDIASQIVTLYNSIVSVGVHCAPSIKVAEAAKVIENTQRDLNIALMNELAIIFDRMHIATRDVLAAASTKWNFLPFTPGLVGGHCIGVDPYYLTTKAEELGYHPQVILAGRQINDNMGFWLAQRLIKLLVNSAVPVKGAKVGVLGLTFKENVSDLRNSRVPDIVRELREFGIEPVIHDPVADEREALEHYGIKLSQWHELGELDACVLAVAHQEYRTMGERVLSDLLRPKGIFVDIKSMLNRNKLPDDKIYWSL